MPSLAHNLQRYASVMGLWHITNVKVAVRIKHSVVKKKTTFYSSETGNPTLFSSLEAHEKKTSIVVTWLYVPLH